MISVDPLSCSSCFFLNSENSRLTVSRVVPMISAISWCVSVSFTSIPPSPFGDFGVHDSRSLANFFGRRRRQAQGADLLVRGVIVPVQLLRDAQVDFPVVFEELQQRFAGD